MDAAHVPRRLALAEARAKARRRGCERDPDAGAPKTPSSERTKVSERRTREKDNEH